MLTIKRLLPHDAVTCAQWDAFVLACPQATFFHRSGWQKIIGDIYRHDTYFLYAEEGGQIVGVLPLGHVNSWLFGNSLTSLPLRSMVVWWPSVRKLQTHLSGRRRKLPNAWG